MRPRSGASGSPFGRRHALHDGLQHQVDVGALLGRHEDDLLARDGQHVLQLLHDHVGLRRGQVDLVDDGHDDEALGEGEVHVGERLGLDALGGVDDEDGALAGLEAAADLVAEVDVAGRVDEVEAVHLAVARGVLQAHRAGLDGDALLALQVHRVEHLARHLARLDGVRQLQDAVGQRRLPVVDVGDDAEVAQARLRDADHGAARVYPRRSGQPPAAADGHARSADPTSGTPGPGATGTPVGWRCGWVRTSMAREGRPAPGRPPAKRNRVDGWLCGDCQVPQHAQGEELLPLQRAAPLRRVRG